MLNYLLIYGSEFTTPWLTVKSMLLTDSQSLLLVQLYWAGGQEREGHFLSDQHGSTAEYFQKQDRCHFLFSQDNNRANVYTIRGSM